MNQFIIPNALQIVIDDMGWMNGEDDRKKQGPSRSAMPRKHCAEDYAVVNELGKALGMKINCAFVIGEWDPDNRLKRLPNFSKYGEDWDNAKYLDREEMKKIIEVVNASDYIDISIHGLIHGHYGGDVAFWDASDFYLKENGVVRLIPEAQIRERLDAFFGILKHYGVKKTVNSYVPTSGLHFYKSISKIMYEYGIKYIAQPFCFTDFKGEDPYLVTVENGIITTDRCNYIEENGIDERVNILPWDQCASDFTVLPKATCIVGSHWPNYLQIDPARSKDYVAATAEYFRSCADIFGTIMSRDLAFYSTQALYKRFAKTKEENGTFTVDISEVPKPVGNLGKFYISTRQPIESFVGAEIKLYETKETHFTYEVTPLENVLRFS